jgi:hypothetical protein
MTAGLLLAFVLGCFALLLLVAWRTSRKASNEKPARRDAPSRRP